MRLLGAADCAPATRPHVSVGVDRWFVGVMLTCAVLYALALPRMLTRLDPLTGDEPFYVMTALSLVHDRDLDEANNYADADFEAFYPTDPLPSGWQGWPSFPRPLPPHPANTDVGGLHTKHGLGLSFLIALPFAALGRAGAVFVVQLCATLLAGQMYLLAREAGARAHVAAAVAAALALTLPLAPYAFLLFPEIPAALLLVYAVRRLSAATNSELQLLLAGLATGFLPWLHQRFAPTSAALAAALLLRYARRRRWDELTTALTPVVVLGSLLVAYNLWLYRSPLQDTRDHAGFSDLAGTLNGAFGLLLDAQWGLLIAAPVYLLALVGAPRWWRAAPDTARLTVLALLPYLALVAAYRVWWGEWGPPARYLVPVVPLAAGALALLLERAGSVPRALFVFGLLWSALLTLVGLADPQRLYHHPDGWNRLAARAGELLHVDVAAHLVAFQPYAVAPRHERVTAVLLLLAAVMALALVVYVAPRLRRARTVSVPQPR